MSDKNEKEEHYRVNDWDVYVRQGPIMKSRDVDRFPKDFGFPAPEMTFKDNVLGLSWKQGAWSIEFTALDALRLVQLKEPSELRQVSFAREWKQTREHKHEDMKMLKPYDWTYYSEYQGTVQSAEEDLKLLNPSIPSSPADEPVAIPIQEILQAGENLWYGETLLYEDELADNGKSVYDVRVRVVNGHLLLLARCMVRLDNVEVRINETRVYVNLTSNVVIRDYRKKEGAYSDVLSRIPAGMDIGSQLDDAVWLSSVLPQVVHEVSRIA
ncbi:TIP41-like type 2a phosphatase regulator Tip41 [Schizosaccharomyces japonicus yFS275]|uniref:TIP41-like type 2a phosphatase regulator Tip41 n=1 Tax=Schizosaccharomyces japonicus (strain yFS275 / FY16936) TaxID=402676 RepID=B6JZV2_SCHJY|nr:TIP41-like type 2a phosphatase regulator Tip41 [Schizosaccharomyces japonicus yFS275]EEB06102.1 TIP41-like type 2a phosphatase regulator Tip41 [Schizosaccharomyces japonicus yFS275]